MNASRGAALVGSAAVAFVGLAVVLAWLPGSPVAPDDGTHEVSGTAWWFLAAVTAAFAAYVVGLPLARRARIGPVVAIGVIMQLAPLASPLLLSTDAWAYWGYGWIAANEGNPYADAPEDVPASPAAGYVGAAWRDTTSVYGPAFTLASEPLARIAGDSPDRAAWLFKTLAAAATLAAATLAARVARSPRLAFALVAWNPVIAVHMAGGGHNDAWLGALLAAALALAATGRRSASGAVWAIAILVKWIPALLLLLQLLAPAANERRPRVHAVAVGGLVVLTLATWRYGLSWAGAVAPLAGNVARETSFALPARLEGLGLPGSAALTLAAAGFVAGFAWLARESRTGRPRLGLAACLLLATTPYLAVWYLGWAVPLAAADDDDRAAVAGVILLTAYLLPQAIPL